MSAWFVLPLLSPRAKGVWGVFAAVSIRKRGSEISAGYWSAGAIEPFFRPAAVLPPVDRNTRAMASTQRAEQG